MDKATTIFNCSLCDKRIRREEECRHLENSEELLDYVFKNKLLKLQISLHNHMDVDVQKIDTATQTDPILDLPTKGITIAETKSSSGFDTASTNSSITFDSSSLPFFSLPKSCRKCSICTIYFSNKTHFIEVDNELRVNCLLDHHIYTQENSRCCIGHFINGKLGQKSIGTIKNKKRKKKKEKRKNIQSLVTR